MQFCSNSLFAYYSLMLNMKVEPEDSFIGYYVSDHSLALLESLLRPSQEIVYHIAGSTKN